MRSAQKTRSFKRGARENGTISILSQPMVIVENEGPDGWKADEARSSNPVSLLHDAFLYAGRHGSNRNVDQGLPSCTHYLPLMAPTPAVLAAGTPCIAFIVTSLRVSQRALANLRLFCDTQNVAKLV